MSILVHGDGSVYLNLPGKPYKSNRMIGHIVGGEFHCDRDPERHLFQKLNAFGFCYELIKRGQFQKVVVHLSSGEVLVASRQYILKHGIVLNFKKNHLEAQIFLPLTEFGKNSMDEDLPTGTLEPPIPPPPPNSDELHPTGDVHQTEGNQYSFDFGGAA